jgi:anthranilate synthase component 1
MKHSPSGYLCRRVDTYRDLLALQRACPERYPFLLESVARGARNARFDILFGFPQDSLVLTVQGQLCASGHRFGDADFLEALDAWWQEVSSAQAAPVDVPFRGGWFVYLGYELAAQIEPRVRFPRETAALPVATAHRIPAALIRDHLLHQTMLVVEADRPELLELLQHDLDRAPQSAYTARPLIEGPMQEEPPGYFLERVHTIKHYIREGHVYQVNLSRHWFGSLCVEADDGAIYDRLRRCNPSPFAGLATLGGATILSSSPERLVRVFQGIVETRPIAGTHPRLQVQEVDRTMARALLASLKEQSEHVMLIDLERNDLGKVCERGSITVNELLQLESYAHVHHIVSNVRGRLIPGMTPGRVLRALFPGGTITGCPKVRCMELIADLEQGPRGAYTGAMGYLNRDGSMDFNILIRTLVRRGRHISLRAGAGIVADSMPLRELSETRQKARGPLQALSGAPK